MVLLIWVIIVAGCSNNKITITTEYIVNENWTRKAEEKGANSIEIRRMKIKRDSTINPFSELSQADILNKLETDSTFFFVANIKIDQRERYEAKKIYFNRDNGFDWWADRGERKTKVLGELQSNTWYQISGLTYYYYIVYVDNADKIHRFVINTANY